jgi:Zn finger protein HypA/HybF involved in hydrogenase expression
MSKLFEARHSKSYNDVIKACNMNMTMVDAAKSVDIPYKTFIRIAKKLGCFKPNIGRKGFSKKSTNKISLSEILNGDHPQYQTNKLKIRLIQEGHKKNACEQCGISNWNNMPITLELDHINGNNSDHRFENLRILCPNCHSQTLTFSNRKR